MARSVLHPEVNSSSRLAFVGCSTGQSACPLQHRLGLGCPSWRKVGSKIICMRSWNGSKIVNDRCSFQREKKEHTLGHHRGETKPEPSHLKIKATKVKAPILDFGSKKSWQNAGNQFVFIFYIQYIYIRSSNIDGTLYEVKSFKRTLEDICCIDTSWIPLAFFFRKSSGRKIVIKWPFSQCRSAPSVYLTHLFTGGPQ